MLVFSDGKNSVISGTYPFPYSFTKDSYIFDATRRGKLAPFFTLLAFTLVFCFSYLLIERPEATGLMAFSFGYPSLIIVLRLLVQKKHKMSRARMKVVGIAPAMIWLEHLALCCALGFGALWANEMQGFHLLAPNIFTGIVCLSIAASVWPYINLLLLRRRPQSFGFAEFEKKQQTQCID